MIEKFKMISNDDDDDLPHWFSMVDFFSNLLDFFFICCGNVVNVCVCVRVRIEILDEYINDKCKKEKTIGTTRHPGVYVILKNF